MCFPKPGSLRQDESTVVWGWRWSSSKRMDGAFIGHSLFLATKHSGLCTLLSVPWGRPSLRWPSHRQESPPSALKARTGSNLSPDLWNKTAHTGQRQNMVGFLPSEAEPDNILKGSRCSTSKPASWSRVKRWTRCCKMPSNSHGSDSRPWSSAGEDPAWPVQPCGAVWLMCTQLP